MNHSSTDLYNFQYLVIAGRVCDRDTGEILDEFDRSCIDWVGSLEYMTVDGLYSIYCVLYSDFPDFVPGWWIDANARSARFRADVRSTESARSLGLSNSNKVVEIRNTQTGEVFRVDRLQSRLSRMRRRVFAWANAMKPASQGFDKIMVTLTYSGVDDWRAGHIRNFMLGVRSELGAGLVAYAWCAELQRRGAVHYHVILIVRKGVRLEKPDNSGLWPYGITRIEKARTVFYIASYMKKQYQKEGVFPRGLRMFAVWISPAIITKIERWLFRLSSIPRWLADKILELGDLVLGERWERVDGGGWRFAGRYYRSPFQFVGFG